MSKSYFSSTLFQFIFKSLLVFLSSQDSQIIPFCILPQLYDFLSHSTVNYQGDVSLGAEVSLADDVLI